MNFINYLLTVLKTNPDFEEAQINRFVAYFLEVSKWDHEASLILEKDYYEFDEHAKWILKKTPEPDYDSSNLYGFSELKISNERDEQEGVDYALVSTEAGRLIFKKKGLRLREIDENNGYTFVEGIAICIDENYKFGLINKFGEIILDPFYNDISTFSFRQRYLIARKGEKYCLIDFKGKEMPFEFDYIIYKEDYYYHTVYVRSSYAELYLIVIQNELYGVLDQDLQWVLECEYAEIYAVETDFRYYDEATYFILKNKEGKFTYFNPKQKNDFVFSWDDVYWNTNHLYLTFRRGDTYGFFNIKTRKERIVDFPFELDSFSSFNYGYYHIKHAVKKKYALMNYQFELLTTFSFDYPVTVGRENVYISSKTDDKISVEVVFSKEGFFKEFAVEK